MSKPLEPSSSTSTDADGPDVKRAVAFFDGMNLFNHAKEAFGYDYPNYDPIKLFDAVCQDKGWKNTAVRFYTGIPSKEKDSKRHAYWSARSTAMSRSGITVTMRTLRYADTEVICKDGSKEITQVGREKGIDIRIALDVVKMCISDELDVAVLFSQDQDFVELAQEVRRISQLHKRWLRICSAFPVGGGASCGRGIEKTDWIKIDRSLYDSCLDQKDYRPKVFYKPVQNASGIIVERIKSRNKRT